MLDQNQQSAGWLQAGCVTFSLQGKTMICIRDSPIGNPRLKGAANHRRRKPTRGRLVGLEGFFVHVPLNGVLHKLPCAAERQLFLNVSLIGFYSLYTDVQLLCNLAGSVSFADQAEHFEFAIAEV